MSRKVPRVRIPASPLFERFTFALFATIIAIIAAFLSHVLVTMPTPERLPESAAYTKVSIWQKGSSYLLRATLPPKPGETGKRRQQWISTGCKATKAGLKVAQAKAAKLESDLLFERFDWADWLSGVTKAGVTKSTAHDWVQAFLAWKGEAVKDTTIRNDYEPYTRLIECDRPLTAELLTSVCRESTVPHSRARKACVRCFGELARYAGISVDLAGLAGNYSPEAFDPNALPSDEEIEQIWAGIASPMVQWTYGVMATYGIRPHEVYHLDCSRLGEDNVLTVLRGKTGRRVVYPYWSRWVETFRLWDVHAPIAKKGTSNKRLGERTSKAFKRWDVPHIPYALRHAYAIRLARAPNGGVPVAIAARWMGHSVSVHTSTYHSAISEQQYREIWERTQDD